LLRPAQKYLVREKSARFFPRSFKKMAGQVEGNPRKKRRALRHRNASISAQLTDPIAELFSNQQQTDVAAR